MRGLLLIGLFVALGCDSGTPSDTGEGGSDASSGGTTFPTASSTTDTTSSGTTDSTSTTMGGTDDSSTTDPTSRGSSTTGETSGSSGSTGSAGPLVPADCRTLLEEDPTTPTGIHTVRVAGQPDGLEVDVYCDMDVDGGGWTLVGRSVGGAPDVAFGWFSSTGSVDDDLAPYSVDAAAALLDFTEILVGTYTTGKTWGPNAFSIQVPDNFIYIYTDAPVSLTPVTVLGTCTPDGGPTRLRNWGNTELEDRFWFNSDLFDLTDGLEPHQLDVDTGDCSVTGDLDSPAGMVFVR